MGSQRVGRDWVTRIHLGEKLLTVIGRGIFSFEGFPCVALNKYQSKQNFLKKVHYDSRVLGWAHSFSPWTSIVLTKCLVDKWPLWIAWSRWWTAWPGVLQCMRSQRVGYDWATELNWTDLKRTMANSMASSPITSGQIDGETMETVRDLIVLGSKITADADCSHEIKRCLLLGRKIMMNLDSILKSRDITLPTEFHLVKFMVFPLVMYGCESWTIKKTERQRIDAYELWC